MKPKSKKTNRILLSDRDYVLWTLLIQVRELLYRAREREVNQYGITARQAAVLFIIEAIGGRATPAEISRWIFRAPHSISNIVSRMERIGLVRKTKDLERRNLVRVTLTEKGRKAYKQSLKRESVHRIISSLSEKDREQLKSYFELLRNRALEELGVTQKPPFPP